MSWKPPRNKPLGATGKFPQGKVHASDEGELRFAVGIDREHGTVMLEFGTPVTWLALPPAAAIQLGETLIKRAAECPPRSKPS